MPQLSASPVVSPPATSAVVSRADEVFNRVSPYPGDGLRNHSRRLFQFTSKLLALHGVELELDTAYAIAMCHDLGLVTTLDRGPTYLKRSRALFHREMEGLELGTTTEIIDECLLFNHRLLPVPNLSPQADAFRRAVQIEHTHGFLRFGLNASCVDAVFAKYPRDNFDRVLLDFSWRVARREPWTLLKGIFF
jgi:hypothetical protein